MAKKRTTIKQKDTCDHDWRRKSATHTNWDGKGWGFYVHRACRKCAVIEWMTFVPCRLKEVTPDVEEKIKRLLQE